METLGHSQISLALDITPMCCRICKPRLRLECRRLLERMAVRMAVYGGEHLG
jgi:hypothetical protein